MECIGILTVGELTNPDLMKFTRVLYPCSLAVWVQETSFRCSRTVYI